MSLARELLEALDDEKPEGTSGEIDQGEDHDIAREGERIPLATGQQVEIRTKLGALVATGYIAELSQETNTVRVRDQGSGADLFIDVNLDLYEVWVREVEIPGDAPTPAKQPKLSGNPRKPGAYTGGTFSM